VDWHCGNASLEYDVKVMPSFVGESKALHWKISSSEDNGVGIFVNRFQFILVMQL
jgi:hypothetical protein